MNTQSDQAELPAELLTIRTQLSALGAELIRHLATIWQGTEKRGEGTDPESYLLELYRSICPWLKSPTLVAHLSHLTREDAAISRIMSGRDFPEAVDKELSAERFAHLSRVVNPSNPVTVELLGRRCALVERVGEIKRAHGIPLRHPKREASLVEEAQRMAATEGLPAEVVSAVYYSLLFPFAFEIEAGTA